MMDGEGVTWFAIKEGGEIIAFASIFFTKSTARSKSLLVLSEHRGKGLARILLNHSIKFIKQQFIFGNTNADKITAFCNENSIHLYKTMGFVEGGKNASGATYMALKIG